MTNDSNAVFSSICRLLDEHDCQYTVTEHEPTYTSEESALARGETLRVGAKALVLKVDDTFAIFVMPADQRLVSKAVKKMLGVRKVRFASKEELQDLTGLVPGAIPPFGPPLFDLPLFVDRQLYQGPILAFNAGDLQKSITMSAEDHLRVAKPKLFDNV